MAGERSAGKRAPTRTELALVSAGAALVLAGFAPPAAAKPRPVDLAAYEDFLWQAPTSQRAVRQIRARSLAEGIREVSLDGDDCATVRAGDRLLFTFGERAAVLVAVAAGREDHSGLAIVGAHLDAPALRLTPSALTEARDGAGLHGVAAGGVRLSHYQHRRLRLVGQLTLAGGQTLELTLPDDLIFVAEDGAGTNLSVGAADEGHVVIAATRSEGSDAPSAALKSALATALGAQSLAADALAAAELYLVSADRPRRYGLDAALIGAAGQDDRVLSYALLHGALGVRAPRRTALALFVDREELGSTGRTGAQAPLLEQVVACVGKGRGLSGGGLDAFVRRALSRSRALSTDVKAAVSPLWPEVHDLENAPLLGRGPTLVKYTGHRGKRSASDAHPELSAHVLALAASHRLPLQLSESGRVDEGGGGTIAKFLAAREIDVIDLGVPLLSMHAPLELVHTADLDAAAALIELFLSGASP